MSVKQISQAYMICVALISLVSLIYVYAFPPASMFKSREGVAYFTPKVALPGSGEPISANELIRHYRGD